MLAIRMFFLLGRSLEFPFWVHIAFLPLPQEHISFTLQLQELYRPHTLEHTSWSRDPFKLIGPPGILVYVGYTSIFNIQLKHNFVNIYEFL